MSLTLDNTQIIKRPLVTEKASWEGSERNRYSFVVDINATKTQIANAIAEIYKVRVVGVSTQVRKGKSFRNKYGVGQKSDWKKAIVQVHEEDKIELF
jgi:large subunit ribosomal protein L23